MAETGGTPVEEAPKQQRTTVDGPSWGSSGPGSPADEPEPAEPTVGTGVSLITLGEPVLAEAAADYVRQGLSKRGVTVIDGMSVPGVANTIDAAGEGTSSLVELLRPHARYLVVVRAESMGDRPLKYMRRYDTEFQGRLHLVAHDLVDGAPIGNGIHLPIGYTHLTVERKVGEALRVRFRGVAARLAN